jgi:periplasmic divalent cation tolerance protein
MKFFSVYVTAANEAEAERIGRRAVEEGLAACANIIPRIRSIYRWEDRLHRDSEAAAILKTTAGRLRALMARIRALHSYQVPCIVAWPISAGHRPYLEWVAAECAGRAKARRGRRRR